MTIQKFLSTIAAAPIVPVVVINRAEDAVPLAEALLAGGIRSIEITLRTEAGLPAIKAVAKAKLDIEVGAGTITSVDEMKRCRDAGASFFVSPGATHELLFFAQEQKLTYLPGIVTPSEIIHALQYDQTFLKFFPAGSFGGAAMLKQYAGVFPNVQFCPTGGVSQANVKEYLGLPNVRCVGGSWLAPADAIQNKDWAAITKIAKESIAALN
jgi:2-dehydro-3-deoxyphosphogluconate aldolase/(4S)-4-hydroxy-2-oxoglutarate aldolase